MFDMGTVPLELVHVPPIWVLRDWGENHHDPCLPAEFESDRMRALIATDVTASMFESLTPAAFSRSRRS